MFVGDLFDRGPDSPVVLRLVRRMIDAGRAQCVMGNHELSLLRSKLKSYNFWFHGQGDPTEPAHADQRPLPAEEREAALDFVRSLPLGLERDDLRVAHACWDGQHAEALRGMRCALDAYQHGGEQIAARLDAAQVTNPTERNLAQQNGCPVRVFTSGKEQRADQPFFAGERLRHEARVPWWNDYTDEPFVVFGHYSKTDPKSQNSAGIPLFPADPTQPVNRTLCIDFGVGGRAAQRRNGGPDGTLHLAALRWPEGEVVLDKVKMD